MWISERGRAAKHYLRHYGRIAQGIEKNKQKQSKLLQSTGEITEDEFRKTENDATANKQNISDRRGMQKYKEIP